MRKNVSFVVLCSTALALAPVFSANAGSSKLVIHETKQDASSNSNWGNNAQNQNLSDNGNQIEPPGNNAQGEIEQAAESFDSFALLMPKVIKARFQAFMTHGFKAVLLPNREEEPNETRMIDALIRGLQALGNSLAQDMQPKSQPLDDQRVAEKQIRARH